MVKVKNQPRTARRFPRENLQTLQWHLTNRCTWRCKHCYADTYEGEELSLSELKRVFLEYIELLKKTGRRGRLNLTGGEPFIRSDFLEFLEFISQYKDFFGRCSILTNGSLLTDSVLKKIAQKAPIVTNIQISIEGDQKINDSIRGPGTFEKILAAADLVKSHGIPVHLAATISKLNYPRIFDLLDLLITYDIPLNLRRFVPIGQGKKEIAMMLSPTELRRFYRKTEELNQAYQIQSRPGRALFEANMCTSGIRYLDQPEGEFRTCGVKRGGGLAIMPDGEVYPCRLYPISMGNVKDNHLISIHEQGYKKILYQNQPDKKCQSCKVFEKCNGGAGCVSAAVTGNLFACDPQCWKQCPLSRE